MSDTVSQTDFRHINPHDLIAAAEGLEASLAHLRSSLADHCGFLDPALLGAEMQRLRDRVNELEARPNEERLAELRQRLEWVEELGRLRAENEALRKRLEAAP